MADLFYSFGLANPGRDHAPQLPEFLRDLRRPDGEVIDLATIDILRDRERGVPRYNTFRELMHKPRIARSKSWPTAAPGPPRGAALGLRPDRRA